MNAQKMPPEVFYKKVALENFVNFTSVVISSNKDTDLTSLPANKHTYVCVSR